VRTVHDRARAVLEHGGEFDVVQVVWSCVDAERPQAALRGASIELKTLAYVVSVPGSADSLRMAVASMLRLAVRGLQGRVGTVTVSLENVGPVVRLLVLAPGAAVLGGASPAAALLRSVAGAGLGFGLLWIVGFAHARVSAAAGRTFAHWPAEGEAYPRAGSLDYWTWFPGMGFGDVKLMAMIGAFLGPVGVIECVVLASFAGLVLGFAWWLVRRDWDAPFGFGPALSVGALLVALSPWRLALPF